MEESTIKLIKKYIDSVKEIRDYSDILYKYLGLEVEGEFMRKFYILEETCKEAIKLLTNQDIIDWVEWFIWENEYGEKGFEAGYDKDLKKITDFDIFVEHILKK